MSGSEPGIMSGRESFGIGLQKNQIPSQNSGLPNMRLAYSSDGTAVYKPVTVNSPTYHTTITTTTTGGSTAPVGGGGVGDGQMVQIPQQGINMNMGEPMKRKRGRPRKYGPDGSMSLSLPPPQAAGGAASSPPVQPPTGFPSSPPLSASPSSTPALKKGRGRPLGSGKKQQMDALGSAGLGFTPHVITVKAGEDVSAKIMSFSQHGSRAVCILSANGAISNVTLRQAATSGGTVTYEGRFEILSLSGSFLYSETGGQRSRTGGLSVSLAGPDGRVLGGGVGGMLTAASPVQVVVGSFIVDSHKESKLLNQSEPSSAPHKLPVGGGGGGGTSGAASSPPSTSSGGPGSPLNQSTGAFNSNNAPGMANISWK